MHSCCQNLCTSICHFLCTVIYRLQLNEKWSTKKCLELLPNANFKLATKRKKEKQKWIVELIREDYTLLSIATVLGIAIAILGLALALFSQKLIDEIIPKKDFLKLNLGIALVFILLISKEGLTYLRYLLLMRQSKDFSIRIIDFFYIHLLNLNKSFFDTRKVGDLIARLNDTSRIQSVISQLAGNAIIEFMLVLVSIIFVFFYSWHVGIGCLIVIPSLIYLIYSHNKKIIAGQRNMMGNYSAVESNYISTLQGIESIKNFNKESLFSMSNQTIYQTYQNSIFQLGQIKIKLGLTANMLGICFLVWVLVFSSYRVMGNHLKMGELMAIIGICGSLLPAITNLALLIIPINEAKIAFDRMFQFTSIEPEDECQTGSIKEFQSLDVVDVTFRFTGRSLLLKGVSFSLNRGEIIAIMGENGSGKSTITQILQKHSKHESGEVIINNSLNINETRTAAWRKIVGVVPQNIHIFNTSILENIGFEDAKNSPSKVLDFLQEYGFTDILDMFPLKYMTIVGEEGINISGGQKQIIGLARALYHKPQLLILDEATSAMDREIELFVLALLQKLKKTTGIIFITHRLQVLKGFCDKIYIIENGIASATGTHDELLQFNNLYSNYWSDLN